MSLVLVFCKLHNYFVFRNLDIKQTAEEDKAHIYQIDGLLLPTLNTAANNVAWVCDTTAGTVDNLLDGGDLFEGLTTAIRCRM